MLSNPIRRLRPSLCSNLPRFQTVLDPRLFQIFHRYSSRSHGNHDYQKRVAQLQDHYGPKQQWYPRLKLGNKISIKEFVARYESIGKAETLSEETVSVLGRIKSIRAAGAKLLFITVDQDEVDVQIVLRHADFASSLGIESIAKFASVARKGDTFAFAGVPHRTQRGQLSILATDAPLLFSPSLHQIPDKVVDQEFLSHNRHVQMLIDPDARQALRIRHAVERTIDAYLTDRGFTKVATPVLQASAGGAIARPFETRATEFSDKALQLRIAPELWLKRLILGGMDRVFEIGPVFRNEGIDATHNPEFSICEFYAAHTSLDELIAWTEQLMTELAKVTSVDSLSQSTPYAQLEFVPTLEHRLGHALPDLDAPNAKSKLTEIIIANKVHMPSHPSLPRLLDALAAHYIEPDCQAATFITNHPAALSPLAKQFTCPNTGQRVAARAELFVQGREIANMYEEQNSPFLQSEAFIGQLQHRAVDGEGDDGPGQLDRAYLEALEWGLPPTGGWGCGLDRLVMLFSGKKRIADVLPFGTLRNVVGTGS